MIRFAPLAVAMASLLGGYATVHDAVAATNPFDTVLVQEPVGPDAALFLVESIRPVTHEGATVANDEVIVSDIDAAGIRHRGSASHRAVAGHGCADGDAAHAVVSITAGDVGGRARIPGSP